MVTDQFGIKLLYPSNKLNFQYYAFPRKKSVAAVSLRENVISRGTFTFFTLPEWGITDRVYSIEYVETFEQIKNQYLDEEDFRNVENPVNATIQVYSDAFHYDPAHGGTGGVEVDPFCEQNHKTSATQGYSRSPIEFRNVEVTSYFFVDEIDAKDGYIFFEARSNNNHPGWDSQCCSDHGYGVRLFAGTESTYKGKIAFYKRTFSGGQKILPSVTQTPNVIIDQFYQKAFGVKFVIYNPDYESNERVRMELYLTEVDWEHPEAEASNTWTKVAEVEDFVGKHWTNFGKECGAEFDDQPITWAAPFVSFGWRKIRHAKFMYTSFREIDINGNFGEDPIPAPNPGSDPTAPNAPDPVVLPEPNPPPDAEPPLTPTTVTKRLTLRRELVNSSTCVCNGVKTDVGVPPDPDPGGGGGGGGGTGTLNQLYFVPISTSGFAKLASVSNSTAYYLRFGQAVTQTNSAWIGKKIVRVEITIAEKADPRHGTGGGVHCRIRKASDDSIAATLSPIASEDNIKNTGIVHVYENLANNYQMKYQDKLLLEYDGGDGDNYVKIFRRGNQPNTGTKIVWQNNDDDAGDYHYNADLDLCARIFYKTGTPSSISETDYDVQRYHKHRYDVLSVAD